MVINDYLSLKFHELYKSNSNDRLAVGILDPCAKGFESRKGLSSEQGRGMTTHISSPAIADITLGEASYARLLFSKSNP